MQAILQMSVTKGKGVFEKHTVWQSWRQIKESFGLSCVAETRLSPK